LNHLRAKVVTFVDKKSDKRMESLARPLSNLQLELLKTFSHHLSDQDLLQVKILLAAFFAKKSIETANKVWDEEGWNPEKVDQLLRTKLRTPYQHK
jgi:hypothetical protein